MSLGKQIQIMELKVEEVGVRIFMYEALINIILDFENETQDQDKLKKRGKLGLSVHVPHSK